MERYNEMMPSGHVVSPGCRMEQALQSPHWPQLWVTVTATFLPKWIRMSGAPGQGSNGTLDNWFHGCRRHCSATQGIQPGAKPFSYPRYLISLGKTKRSRREPSIHGVWIRWELRQNSKCVELTRNWFKLKSVLRHLHRAQILCLQKNSINKNRNPWLSKTFYESKKGVSCNPTD